MRAREFIVERLLPKKKRAVMPFAKQFPTMPSSDPYRAYRFGMAMASKGMKHVQGPAEANAIIVAYTDVEEEIIKHGEKLTGHKGIPLTDKTSHEPDSTYTLSPVAKSKRNRFGI